MYLTKILNQIHSSFSVFFFPSSIFPLSQTDPNTLKKTLIFPKNITLITFFTLPTMMHLNNRKITQPFSSYGTQWKKNPCYNKQPSKVVSIPIQFVVSERNRAESAMKIQRVAKGYLVRKSLKKMLKIKVELNEIEKNVNDEETVKKMKKEQKERIRIGESIMNLLLRLDCVRVFHCSALRDLRKSIIKKAIFLQEFVDQIQMVGYTDEVEGGEEKFEKEEVGCEEENGGGKKIEALGNVGGEKIEGFVNEDNGGGEKIEALGNGDEEVNSLEKEEGGCEEENEGGERMEDLRNEGKCVKDEENCLMEEKEEEGEDEEGYKMEEEKEESVGTSLVEDGIEEDSVRMMEEGEDEGRIVIRREEKERDKEGDVESRKMLKRMMEDNEKMMEMMAQLYERNEKQTTLLTSLTQRVEQLERAFTCDKLRRKKKRRNGLECSF